MIRTVSVYLRRGTSIFAQIFVGNDSSIFVNFNLETCQVNRSAGVIASTITSGRDGWYRCTLTHSSSTANSLAIGIISFATANRGEVNTLDTSIYVAGAQNEEGAFATNYINTEATTVTRGGDFASIYYRT